MSSSEEKIVPDLQKLYDDEHIRVGALERKNARLQADFEKEKARLQAELGEEKASVEKLQDQLEASQATVEVRDASIQDLHKAFDDADRPIGSDGDKKLQDLQARIRLLEDQNRDLNQKFARAGSAVEKHKTKYAQLQEYTRSLQKDHVELGATAANVLGVNKLEIIRDAREALGLAMSCVLEDEGARVKLEQQLATDKRKYATFVSQEEPATQALGPRPSSGPRAPPATSKPDEGKGGNVTEQARKKVKTVLEATTHGGFEGIAKPQEGTASGFSLPPRNKVAAVTKGPNQESFVEQAASTNPYASLTDQGAWGPGSAAKIKLSGDRPQSPPRSTSNEQSRKIFKLQKVSDDTRQPSPILQSIEQTDRPLVPTNAADDVQKQRSVSQPRNANKEKASPKPFFPNKERASPKPSVPFNPATSIPAPSSRSTAQIAASSPKPKPSAALEHVRRTFGAQVPNTKPTDQMRMQASHMVFGKLVQPGKPVPKSEQTTPENSGDGTSIETQGLESSAKPSPKLDEQVAGAKTELAPAPAGKSVSMQELEQHIEQNMGPMPEKWGDMTDSAGQGQGHGQEQVAPDAAHPPMGDQVQPEKSRIVVRLPNQGDGTPPKEPDSTESAPASGSTDQVALEETGVATDPPATAQSHPQENPKAEQESLDEKASDKVAGEAKEQGTIASEPQGEGTSPADLTKGEAVPSTSAAGGRSLRSHQGKKDFQEEDLYKGKPGRQKGRNRRKKDLDKEKGKPSDPGDKAPM